VKLIKFHTVLFSLQDKESEESKLLRCLFQLYIFILFLEYVPFTVYTGSCNVRLQRYPNTPDVIWCNDDTFITAPFQPSGVAAAILSA
jgi:hypothetical protein